ncbi:MAG: hypothetical protein WDA02_10480 [Saccharofermentanales bacterium]|jgi:hypothetical protein
MIYDKKYKNRIKRITIILFWLFVSFMSIGVVTCLLPSVYSLYMIETNIDYVMGDKILLVPLIGILIIFFTLFTFGLTFNYFKLKLNEIKKDLIDKRQINHLEMGFKFLKNGENNKVINILNKCLHDGKRKYFLSGMFFYSTLNDKNVKIPNI